MALESFYGGKQGVSPVIKARFKYINKDDQAYKDRIDPNGNNSGGLVTAVTEEEATWLTDAGIKQGETVTLDNNDQDAYEPTTEGSGVSYKKGDLIKWNAVGLKPFTMDECLKDINYRDVWYGELCIIDTDSKYNPNNGKIYRRTLKQVNNHNARVSDTLYAEYVGQIVGPTGGIPKFDISSVDVARQKATGQAKTYNEDVASQNPRQDWSYSYRKESDKYVISSEIPSDYDSIGVFAANDNNSNIDMVPGKVINNNTITYNDSVRYTWCNVTRKNEEGVDQDSWIYLGFEIPYTSWDITYNPISYTQFPSVDDIQEVDDVFHPFYHNLTFNIPRGTRGIGPEEIILVKSTMDNSNNPPTKISNRPTETVIDNTQNPPVTTTQPVTLYSIEAIEYDSNTDTYSLNSGEDNCNIIELTPDSYWIAKFFLPNPPIIDPNTNNSIDTSITVYIYLGEYQDINSMEFIDETGQIVAEYSNNLQVYSTLGNIDYVKSLRIDTDKTIIEDGQEVNNPNFGKLYKISNIVGTNNTEITTLPLIKEIKIDDNDGLLYVTYAGNDTAEPVGHAKYSPTIGLVTQIYPTNAQSYAREIEVITDLNDGWNASGVTIYGTNAGDNSGKIIINNIDYTNGLIGAPIARDPADLSGDKDLGLFYYDGALDANENPKGWTFIGLYGELNNDNGVFVLDGIDNNNQSIYEPLNTSRKPKFYFDYSFKNTSFENNTNIALPILWSTGN